MRRAIQLALLALASALAGGAQTAPQRIELVLEHKGTMGWRAVDPGTVFRNGDLVRFRFKANFDGYLYVVDHGTSGTSKMLYPDRPEADDNRVETGKEYLVPPTGGAYRVTGPAGYDVLSWVVSVAQLPSTRPEVEPSTPPSNPPLNMTPRCNDSIFKARGDCVDPIAGAKSAGPRSRDLVFTKKQNLSVVTSPEPLTEPVLYEFHLAHK